MTFRWRRAPTEVWPDGAERYARRIRAAVFRLMQRYAPEMEAWMKANAPWTDRTGNARQSLEAEAQELGNQALRVLMQHGVEYGIFLELAHGGNWAIIGPALDEFAPRIWRDVQALLS